jgi:hypothetical protein
MTLAQIDQHYALLCRSLHQGQSMAEACLCTPAGQPLRLWAVPAGVPGVLRLLSAEGLDGRGSEGRTCSRFVRNNQMP